MAIFSADSGGIAGAPPLSRDGILCTMLLFILHTLSLVRGKGDREVAGEEGRAGGRGDGGGGRWGLAGMGGGAGRRTGTSFADRALRSFLDIIHTVETSRALQEFAMHPSIQKRMPGKISNCYRIRLGFGLHVGWAIEGAIGSSHKVDPSYLSPHVNMASRLEAATKQYGVSLLISETVIANLTKSNLRDSCRKLDRVTVKGSAEPLMLYTYDMPFFQKDLKGNPQDYKNLFESAVDNYIDGNWNEASDLLKQCAHCGLPINP
eukprot:Gb_03587 [translate_table: standard]